MGVTKAANFSKCPAIAAVANEKQAGPFCEDDMCMRQCKKGFEAVEPVEVFCIKKPNGNSNGMVNLELARQKVPKKATKTQPRNRPRNQQKSQPKNQQMVEQQQPRN